jgi:high mobility group protein B3
MSGTAILENKHYTSLSELIEKTFDPKSKDMRMFREALHSSSIAGLFFNIPGKKTQEIIEKQSADPEKKERKTRGPIQVKPEAERCQAFIYALEKDAETGQWKPKQCARSHEKDGYFCKLHGSVDGKKNEEDSKYAGMDVIHPFKWSRFGCVETGPTYLFEKFKEELIKSAMKAEKNETETSTEAIQKPAKKQRGQKNKEEKPEKPKRTMNAYMIYLQEKREEIKQCLLEQTPELKGKELANKVTETAGAAWKASSELEKKPYLEKAAALKVENNPIQHEEMPPSIDECCGGHAVEAEECQEETNEEDEMKLRYDEKLSVWVDDETNLYYATDDSEQPPLGQVQKDKLMPFKKNK